MGHSTLNPIVHGDIIGTKIQYKIQKGETPHQIIILHRGQLVMDYKHNKLLSFFKDTVRSLYGDQFSSVDDTSSLEETIRKNLLRLEVYFEELNFETMTETPKYPVSGK